MSCKIYTLEHPITGEIRYVGKTEESLCKRLNKHVYASKFSHTHRNNWIQSLIKEGLRPTISLVEEVNLSEWEHYEKYWISQFRAWGFNLVNGTEGGEAVYTQGQTYEQKYGVEKAKALKEKLSQAQKNLYSNGYINPMKGIKGIDHHMYGKPKTKEAVDSWRKSREGWKHTMDSKIAVSKSKTNGKTIAEIDLDGNIIKQFDNIYEVVSLYNLKKQLILDVLCGQQKTTSGHKFKYITN